MSTLVNEDSKEQHAIHMMMQTKVSKLYSTLQTNKSKKYHTYKIINHEQVC